MSERLRESLSALMDDEADDLELGRILRAMDSGEADLATTWSRYQLVSAVLKGSPASVGMRPLALDLEAADVDSDVGHADGVIGIDRAPLAPEAARGRGRRALGSFAVAASITAVAVVGWQWQSVNEGEPTQVASGAPMTAPEKGPATSILPALRTADQRGLLQASEQGRFGRDAVRAQSAAAGATAAAAEVDMRQRVEAYMIRHAEHNALHSRSGMMPFARMAAFDGAQ